MTSALGMTATPGTSGRAGPPLTLVHLWALGAGDQISRMIAGALRDCGQIKGGSGDVKADLHLRRVLGRAVYGEEISGADATKVIELICARPKSIYPSFQLIEIEILWTFEGGK